jgi:acyl-CoA reductase-like NAD-dependent aldehyde dehydrogenase
MHRMLSSVNWRMRCCDDAVAERVTRQLVAGTVSVNCHGMAAQDPPVPFGGVGQSGLGRELGADRIRAFTQPRGYVRQAAPQQ